MSYFDIILLRIVVIYVFGALCSTTIIVRDIDFYDEELVKYAKKLKVRRFRLYRAAMYASLAVFWPIDILYTIYFKYFYSGDDNDD